MPKPLYPPPRDPDHIDTKEVVRLLGLSRRTLYNYRYEPDFPEPVGTEGRTVLYSRTAILAWKAQREGHK